MLNKHIFLLTHFRSILYAIKSPCFKIFFCYRQNRNVHWETSLLLSLKFTPITVSNNLLQDFSSLNALRANLFHKRMRVEYSIFRFGWWNIFFCICSLGHVQVIPDDLSGGWTCSVVIQKILQLGLVHESTPNKRIGTANIGSPF